MAIKIFELKITALQTLKQLNVDYATVMKICDMLRKVIYYKIEGKGKYLDEEIEVDESYFGVKGVVEQVTRLRCLVY
ncbi:MAG: hypothetical protein ACK4F9_04915 [Brevinematia bacterium]